MRWEHWEVCAVITMTSQLKSTYRFFLSSVSMSKFTSPVSRFLLTIAHLIKRLPYGGGVGKRLGSRLTFPSLFARGLPGQILSHCCTREEGRAGSAWGGCGGMGVQGLSVPHLYQPSRKPPHVPDQMGHTPSPLRVSFLSPEAIKQE